MARRRLRLPFYLTLLGLAYLSRRVLLGEDGVAAPSPGSGALAGVKRMTSVRAPAAERRRALGVAPSPAPFPHACISHAEFDPVHDENCFLVVRNLTRAEMAEDPTRPFCWGYNSSDAAGGDVTEPPAMLYHTIALTGVPAAIVLPVWSFLATQCCDAVLWFWVGPNVSIPADIFGIPPHLAHRLVWKRLDLEAMFDAVREDFPPVPRNVTDALQGFTDIRYVADWARLLVMYTHGGLYFDIDTVLLRDLRPLYGLIPTSMLTYREAPGPYMNNAFLRLPQRPSVAGWEVVHDVLKTGSPLPEKVCDAIARRPGGYGNLISPHKMTRLSMSTVDFIWFKFLGKGNNAFWSPGMRDIHPELSVALHWNDFFNPLPADMAQRVRAGKEWFMEGSYAYHWHNRYDRGLGHADSWAALLAERYKAIAMGKFCA